MDSRRIRNLRNNFDKNIIDKQVDKIFETGRQFVDGVSGARPGKKRNSDFQAISSKNVKKVGRWVSEKVDLFFDDENDDWYDEESFYEDKNESKTFTREIRSSKTSQSHTKRPLEALSLRQPKNLSIKEQKKLPYGKEDTTENWPDDVDFKVDRWQRSTALERNSVGLQDKQRNGLSKVRNLPRSRRRRI